MQPAPNTHVAGAAHACSLRPMHLQAFAMRGCFLGLGQRMEHGLHLSVYILLLKPECFLFWL